MAKATLTLPDGTNVTIEGDTEEISKLLGKFSGPSQDKQSTKQKSKIAKNRAGLKTKKGPQDYILELRQEGFFKSRRSIADVQKKLEEKGHIYPQERLSSPLIRLVRKRELRRMKEKKGWIYVA